MQRSNLGFSLVVVVATWLSACSSDDSGDNGTDATGGAGGVGGAGGAGGTAFASEGGSWTNPGTSGVDGDKYLDELTDAETLTLCRWTVPVQGGPGETPCSDSSTMVVPTVEECVTKLSSPTVPHCLVSDTEACLNSIAGDPCLLTTTKSCQIYTACVLGG
jgi:hypothetical protein